APGPGADADPQDQVHLRTRTDPRGRRAHGRSLAMNLQRQIAKRLVETCLENSLFGEQPERLDVDEIGDLDLRDNVWFHSMSLVFLQVEIESEGGVHIPRTQFATWLRTLKHVAG